MKPSLECLSLKDACSKSLVLTLAVFSLTACDNSSEPTSTETTLSDSNGRIDLELTVRTFDRTFSRRAMMLEILIRNNSESAICVPSFYDGKGDVAYQFFSITSSQGKSIAIGEPYLFSNAPWDEYVIVPNSGERLFSYYPNGLLHNSDGPATLNLDVVIADCENTLQDNKLTFQDIVSDPGYKISQLANRFEVRDLIINW